jgi:ABC-type methionine transport system ATPase subunit
LTRRCVGARALSTAPSAVLGEGASHLDIATARQITAEVKALGLTRVIIA